MIPWLGGFVALDAVENDLHLEEPCMCLWRNDTVCLMSCVLYRFFRCRLFIVSVLGETLASAKGLQ